MVSPSSTNIKIIGKSVGIGFVSFITVFLSYVISVEIAMTSLKEFATTGVFYKESTTLIVLLFVFLFLPLILMVSGKLLSLIEKIDFIVQRKTQLLFFMVFFIINLLTLLLFYWHGFYYFNNPFYQSMFENYFGLPFDLFYSGPPGPIKPGVPDRPPYLYYILIRYTYFSLVLRVLFITGVQFFLFYLIVYSSVRKSDIATLLPHTDSPEENTTFHRILAFLYPLPPILIYFSAILLINQQFWQYLAGLDNTELILTFIIFRNITLGLEIIALLAAVVVNYLILKIIRFDNQLHSAKSIALTIAGIVSTRLILAFVIMWSFTSHTFILLNSLLHFPATNLSYFDQSTYQGGALTTLSPNLEKILILKELLYLIIISTAFVATILFVQEKKIAINNSNSDAEELLFKKNAMSENQEQ